MTNPVHDPEAAAAAYLAGDFTTAGRAEFETHLLACEACWYEVRTARDGRVLAEGLRESAPQSVREYLRTLAATPTEGQVEGPDAEPAAGGARSRSRSRLSLAAAVVAGAALTGGLLLGPLRTGSDDGGQRLVAAASLYGDGDLVVQRAGAPPVARLGALSWQGTTARSLGGEPATVYRYGDAAGRQVILVSSLREFPRAKNAQTVLGASWTAAVDGAVLFCVDHGGLSWLVITDSRDRALTAGRQAGLA